MLLGGGVVGVCVEMEGDLLDQGNCHLRFAFDLGWLEYLALEEG